MKQKLILGLAAFAVALLLAFRHAERIHPPKYTGYRPGLTEKTIIRCSPDWQALSEWIEESDIPPIPGAGSYSWTISTHNDSAQFYFNQGLNMYYSFHIIECMASFKKAARFDPACAILYWAQALAYGPNINDLGYAASPEALAATEKAEELSSSASPMEKALIAAMSVRYTADSADVNRKILNEKYTGMMEKVYNQFPANADAATLYADAMMLEHPWNLWNVDGTPKPWTPRIREVLEKVLAFAPANPGANHYYIHVMEPSPYADKALPCADRLGKLTPGLSHTVHMPSHIYLRTGNYDKGVNVNVAAVMSYQKSIPLYAPVTGADFLYIIHNLHMQSNHAMLAGRSAYTAATNRELLKSIPKDYLSIPGALGNYIQYIWMTPVLADLRFGNWDHLLKTEKPAGGLIYANLLYHFGRGMACVQRSRLDEAKAELVQLQERMKDSSLLVPLTPFSAAIDGADIAENLLIGTIALKEKRFSDAIAAFEEAVVTEENMVYNEPRDWLLNPKHYLGNALLKAGRPAEARQVLEKDLANNRENGWALFGIWQSLTAQKKTGEAAKTLLRFRKAFRQADVKLYGPVF